jgi:dipeptidyl aminopeptidase/acylaminoacyl peptidase
MNLMNRKLLFIPVFFIYFSSVFGQVPLSVEYIMRDPAWMGTFPSSIRWSEDSQKIYFQYNLDKDPADSLYSIAIKRLGNPAKVKWSEEKILGERGSNYSKDRSFRIFKEDRKLLLEEMKSGKVSTILGWHSDFSNPTILANENEIAFNSSNNIYVLDRRTKAVKKVTQISTSSAPTPKSASSNDTTPEFLEAENLALLQVVAEREEKAKLQKAYRKSIADEDEKEFTYYTSGKNPVGLQLSPDGRYATFSNYKTETTKPTKVPNYVAASGYTENLNSRSKVGTKPTKTEIGIYDLQRDTIYFISKSNLDGIKDLPDYVKDYPDKAWEEKEREVIFAGPFFSPDGKNAVIQVRSVDNKDRWIAKVELNSGALETLDRQRDEAWISGPGIGYSFSPGTFGWLPDNEYIYFQSEETGYSHLYLLNVTTGAKKVLTSGNYEVFDPFISKDNKSWYLTTSEVDPGERHFYRMPLMGGKMEKLTTLTGNNEVSLSPDEKKLAVLYSYSNKPEEIYLQDNKVGAAPTQVTFGQSEEFKAYNWRDPQLVRFTAEDGAQVPARLYSPDPAKNNGAAVIFVHGAGTYKMFTNGGVPILENTCFTIYWWTWAIRFWILIIVDLQAMGEIGEQESTDIWEAKIFLTKSMAQNSW